MSSYRVYRVGEEEHVREALAPPPLRRSRRARRVSSVRRAWTWAPVIAAVATAAALFWLYGREAVDNSRAALDILREVETVPGWLLLGAPVVALATMALATAGLAFGRRRAIKVVAVAAVVLVLAAPGLAVGYANGLVVPVGQSGSPETTVQEREQIAAADAEIAPPLPDKPMNILLIGSDRSDIPDDPGRSDTQMLLRLDPDTRSISMLSLPRDLRVYIEGVGYEKMNAAYSYGGPKAVIRTFKELTGLPINGWIETDFAGFWHTVNILGGVYLPIDRKYFVPASANYKSINLEPGYQLVRGKQALNFVRFRHDQRGDFTRMQRQQLFVRELQRQSRRWSGDWDRVIRLIKAITRETRSSLSSLAKIEPLVELAFQVDTSRVYQTHLEGDTPMLDGIAYVTASEGQIAEAVRRFTHPAQAPVRRKDEARVAKNVFPVRVYNGSGIDGLATAAATQLSAQGYKAQAVADDYEYPDRVTAVYAPRSLRSHADAVAAMLSPAEVRVIPRGPGVVDGISVFVASSFDGVLDVPDAVVEERQTLLAGQKVGWETWKLTDAATPLRLQAPVAWPAGSVYDQFHNYSIETTDGRRLAASVAVARTPLSGYWSVQAMRWLRPPAIESPTGTKKVGGRTYMLFYQGDSLHMVAWRERGTLYWVLNTLDDQLSNDVMMGLATSCRPVK